MRVRQLQGAAAEEQEQFVDFLERVDFSDHYALEEDMTCIPDDLCSSTGSLDNLIDQVYGELREHHQDYNYLVASRILTPKNTVVDEINTKVMEQFPQEYHTYLSADSIVDIKHEGLYH